MKNKNETVEEIKPTSCKWINTDGRCTQHLGKDHRTCALVLLAEHVDQRHERVTDLLGPGLPDLRKIK